MFVMAIFFSRKYNKNIQINFEYKRLKVPKDHREREREKKAPNGQVSGTQVREICI